MVATKQTFNIQANSQDTKSDTIISTMSTYMQSSRVNINILIPDMEVASTDENLAVIKADFASFLDNLYKDYNLVKDELSEPDIVPPMYATTTANTSSGTPVVSTNVITETTSTTDTDVKNASTIPDVEPLSEASVTAENPANPATSAVTSSASETPTTTSTTTSASEVAETPAEAKGGTK